MILADLIMDVRAGSEQLDMHPGIGDLAGYLNEFTLHFVPVFGATAIAGNVRYGHQHKPTYISTVQPCLHQVLNPSQRTEAATVESSGHVLAELRAIRAVCCSMAREHFFHAETPALLKKLEELADRSHLSRGQAFEDWLTAMVCTLAAETKEAEYLAMVERHKEGKPGRRGVDLIGAMFAELVFAMEKNEGDVLGDLFEGAISYGENGLFLTPEAVCS